MDVVKSILGQHWPFYSHQKLYDMVRTEARGADAVEDAGQAWMEFVTLMAESRRNIERLLGEAGASWEGAAVEAMRDGVSPLTQWTEDARSAGAASGLSVRRLGESFAYTSNAMPEPVPVPAGESGWSALFTDLFGGQIDQDRRERLAQEAKQRAVELMESYSTNAGAAVSSVGTFVPPQSVTVGVAPAQPLGGRAGTAVDAIVTAPPPEPGAAGPGGGAVEHDTRPAGVGPGSPTTSTAPPVGQPGPTTPRTGDTRPTATNSFFTPATPVRDVVPTRDGTSAAGFGGTVGTSPPNGLAGPRPGRASTAGRREGSGDPGARSGPGQPGAERPAGVRDAAPSAGRHAASGMVPFVPPVALRREEDARHQTPAYLRDFHDDFWEADSSQVAPPVIGEEPEES